MKIQTLIACILFTATTILCAEDAQYNGPDNPIIPADNNKIRLTLPQCIEDINEVTTDTETHDAAKDLCQLREQHQAARQKTLKGLADLVAQYKGMTNHQHDQRLAQTISLIQQNVNTCLEALDSQEYCHNIGCAIEPESDAILCETEASKIINRILGRE